MEKQFKYFLIIIALFLIFNGISVWESSPASAQLGACVDICTGSNIGKCCILAATGETGTCGYDALGEGPKCVSGGGEQTHNECENGKCVPKPGAGPNLCQSEATCRQKVCEGQSCVLKLAPGPGGLGPDQCQTNANCAYSPPPSGPRDPKEGEPTPVPRDSTTQPRQRDSGQGVSIPNPIGPGTFQDLVEQIARYLFQIGIPIAVIMILYAAFLYMTAGGSEEKVSKAHKALTYAVVGLAVLFLAWGITSLVKELLGGETTTGQPQQEYPSERRYLEQYQQQQQNSDQNPINPDDWQF